MKILNRKNVFIILSILMMCVFLSACYDRPSNNPNKYQKNYLNVRYSIVKVLESDLDKKYNGGWSNTNGEFGVVKGEGYYDLSQKTGIAKTVKRGEDAPTVTVETNEGYRFVKWSDTGDTNPTRTDLNVQDDISATAIVVHEGYKAVTYTPTFGGYIEGELSQKVLYGGTATPVLAIPNQDFRFVQWSDGVLSPLRENIKLYKSEKIIAQFERYQRIMKLNYNEATGNNEQEEVVLELDKYLTNSMPNLPVPEREGYIFDGWYQDWHHTIRVTDENGKVIADKRWFNDFREWFDNETLNSRVSPLKNNLYAKWKAVNYVPTYKVLLVFVTEIDAVLKDHDNQDVIVKYNMTEDEKKIFELYGVLVEGYLNAILNGTVNFEVDTHFTTQKITEKEMIRGTTIFKQGGRVFADYGVDTQNLPEISDIVDDYGSILTSFCMNDWDGKLKVSAGNAAKKYGDIHLESCLYQFVDNYKHYFDLQDGVYHMWANEMETYIHEFVHTVDAGLGLFHNAITYYENNYVSYSDFDVIRDYLCGKFEMNGEMAGVPYEFWINNDYGLSG